MEFKFNSLNMIKQPKVSIHRLDLAMIGYLNVTNLVIKPTFCDLSEVAFTCFADTNFYPCLRKDMVLEIEGFGRWVITNVKEDNDGQTKYRNVTANSYEETMNKTTLTYKDNQVFKLWDAIHPEKGIQLNENGTVVRDKDGLTSIIYQEYPTLLWIISQQTGWKIAHVDATLLNEYRTMTIDKEQAYGLLMGGIAEAFKCYFVFDTMKKEIYCYDRKNVPANTGINVSFRNIMNSQNISESSDDIITALTIEGAEGVGINLVNPLGNNTVYDFSYYMNDEDWGMPIGLQESVKNWMDKIDEATPNYVRYVQVSREFSIENVELDGQLNVANAELNALLDAQSVHIAAENNAELEALYPQIEAAQAKVDEIKTAIATLKDSIEYNNERKSNLIKTLSFESNFTEDELAQLQYYINGAVYENANFIYTSVMSEADKIDISQQLYDQGMKEFKKFSQAQYQYDCDISAFMFNKDYRDFTDAMKLGGLVNLELEDNIWVTPKLIQVTIDYDNPSNTTCVLSDSFRLSGGVYDFADGYTQTVKASRKTSLSASKWDEPSNSGLYNKISEYITNALNLTNQEIINADNQEFTLGSWGLRGKMTTEDGKYDPHQVAMTNNVLAFTDDNWRSTKTALGRIKIGEPGEEKEYYGLVAEAVFGRLIAGEQLVIESGDKSFVMDGSGVTLTNAPFTVIKDKSKILINPTDGFKIQKLRTGTDNIWDDVLSEDTDGNIIAKSIRLQSGDIGGWTIETKQLTAPSGDYIASDGRGQLGLMHWNNSECTFNGNIYANNLQWRYGDGDYQSIFNSAGWMSGSWLGEGTVGADRRNVGEWDEIYAKKAAFDALYAAAARIDDLSAGYIVSEGGVQSPIFFGGRYKAYDLEHPERGSAVMFGQIDDTAILDNQKKISMFTQASGKIYLDSPLEVIAGHLKDDNTVEYRRMTAGSFDAKTLVQTKQLDVYPDDTQNGISVNGTVKTQWLQVSNKINNVVVSDKFEVDSNVNAKFNGQAVIEGDTTTNGRLWITGGTALKDSKDAGSFYYGQSTEVRVGDRTLYFKHGLLTGVG